MKMLGIASAAAAAAACIAVGTAGPAAADPDLSGTYNYIVDNTQAISDGGFPVKDPKVDTTQWVITPCGAGCAHVDIPDSPAAPGISSGGDLHLVNGRWEMSRDNVLMNCNPGGPDVTITTSVDAATLQGTQVITNHCFGMVLTAPATLAVA